MTDILSRARSGDCLADLDIIDLHGHIGRLSFTLPDVSLAKCIDAMDRVGISKIFMSHMSVWSPDTENGNKEVADAIQAYPDRFLGYAGIWPGDRTDVEANVEKWFDLGFMGLKLHNANGFNYMDDAYQVAYAMANERHMPMLFHAWGQEDRDFKPIREIAEKYPDTSLILAHTGAGGEEGERGYIDIARDVPNVYLDLALSLTPRGLVQRLVEAVGAERVTFGSDAYFFSLTHQIGKVLGADISDEDKIKILSTNAKKLLTKIQS